jgi:hypothetical protein
MLAIEFGFPQVEEEIPFTQGIRTNLVMYMGQVLLFRYHLIPDPNKCISSLPSPTMNKKSPPAANRLPNDTPTKSLVTGSKEYAPYPPLGHHPSEATTILLREGTKRPARSTSSKPKNTAPHPTPHPSTAIHDTRNVNSASQGRNQTIPNFSIFNVGPSTALTSSLTQGSSMMEAPRRPKA